MTPTVKDPTISEQWDAMEDLVPVNVGVICGRCGLAGHTRGQCLRVVAREPRFSPRPLTSPPLVLQLIAGVVGGALFAFACLVRF